MRDGFVVATVDEFHSRDQAGAVGRPRNRLGRDEPQTVLGDRGRLIGYSEGELDLARGRQDTELVAAVCSVTGDHERIVSDETGLELEFEADVIDDQKGVGLGADSTGRAAFVAASGRGGNRCDGEEADEELHRSASKETGEWHAWLRGRCLGGSVEATERLSSVSFCSVTER